MTSFLDYSHEDLEGLAENFARELVMAATGGKTELSFLKHSLESQTHTPTQEVFQVLSLGGSNLEIARVRFNNDHLEIIETKTQQVPVFSSKQVFLDVLLPQIDRTVNTILLNFAYPLAPEILEGKLDGRLLRGTKEHEFTGLVGELVGQTLATSIRETYDRSVKVQCLNDVVGLALACLPETKADRQVDRYLAMVLGTGNNYGLFLNDKTIVNVESGNFSKFLQTSSGEEIDRNSNSQGSQILEKEVAGAYLYKHFNYYAQTHGLSKRLETSKQLNQLAELSVPAGELAKLVIHRSAAIVAATLKGFWLFKKRQPLFVTVEGSIFWRGYHYQSSVDSVLTELGLANQITFLRREQSSIVGPALLENF